MSTMPTDKIPEPTDAQPTEPDEVEPDDEPSDREAAKYRRRLRETEGERDTISTQLDASRRALVEHLAGGERVKVEALWAAGTTVAELLDDDGAVDPDLVRKACTNAAETLGLARPPRVDRNQGRSQAVGPTENPFSAAFSPRR